MAILDFLKNEEEKKPLEKKDSLVGKKAASKKSVSPKKDAGSAYHILLSPHITEKATILNKDNKYVFKVYPHANKIEIKKAIKSAYGVDVSGVEIINIPKKKRRVGKSSGWRKGYKKAIIKVKKGQKIEILSH